MAARRSTFGGLSEAAREVAAQAADVFLMWPDTLEGVTATIADLRRRAAGHGRMLRFGYRAHVIVRDTEAEARAAASRLVSKLATSSHTLTTAPSSVAEWPVRRRATARTRQATGRIPDESPAGSPAGDSPVGSPRPAPASTECERRRDDRVV